MENKLETKTSVGAIRVYKNAEGYDGVTVMYVTPDGYENDLVNIEVEDGNIAVRVWEDPRSEDYTHKVVIDPKEYPLEEPQEVSIREKLYSMAEKEFDKFEAYLQTLTAKEILTEHAREYSDYTDILYWLDENLNNEDVLPDERVEILVNSGGPIAYIKDCLDKKDDPEMEHIWFTVMDIDTE